MDTITAGSWKGFLGKGLAPRELEATLYAAENMTAKEIAKLMDIAPGTVNKRIDSAKFKLGARTITGLLAECFKRQIIAPLAVSFLAVLIGAQHQQGLQLRRPSSTRRVEVSVTARRDTAGWAA